MLQDPLHDEADLFMDPQEPEMQPTEEDSVYMCAENIEEQDSTREPGAEEEMPFCDLFKGAIKEKVVVCKGDMLLMVLKFALKNNLTFSALTSMIEMVNLFFERPVLPQSKYALGKVFSETGISMTFYFCCDKCFTVTRQAKQGSTVLCPTCSQALTSSSVTDMSFFVLLDPAPQLQKALKGCSILDLSKPLEPVDVVSDIWDGEMYREFVASTMDAGHRISLTLNADGTPLFKSSGTGIWPIQLLVNELPPEQRMNKRVLSALWFGRKKPEMGLFQAAFVESMNDLSTNGFMLEHEGERKLFKAFCICCAVDSVARAPMQGLTQFNGFNGCNWCLQVGESSAGALRYPVQEEEPPERSEEQMVSHMEIALEQGVPESGVMTVSPLLNLPQFHIVWGFVPDYMHCIMLGVARQFLKMWLGKTSCPLYIGKYEDDIGHRLVAITPPREVKRMPRIAKDRRWWKAKEYENWLLYYSVPVLEGLLDRAGIAHWACLVEAVHILLKRDISASDIARAEELLVEFHVRAEHLYDKVCMTFYVHQLLHIVKSVRQWGPLWAHSAYPFEAGNGKLKSVVKSVKGVPHQICRTLQIENVVDNLLQVTTEEGARDYCACLDTVVTQKTNAVEGVRFFGRGVPYCPPENYVNLENSVQYARMRTKGMVFTTRKYAVGKKTNSSAVQLADGSYAVIEKIICQSNIRGYVVVKRLKCTPVKNSLVTMTHLLRVVKEAATYDLLPISEISNISVLIQVDKNVHISPVPSSLTM